MSRYLLPATYLVDTNAVALSVVPHALNTRTQNSVGAVMAAVWNVADVAPEIGKFVLPLWPVNH